MYGMYGMYGVYGTVRYGMEWNGMEWYGMYVCMYACIDRNIVIYVLREWVNIPALMDDGGMGRGVAKPIR